jgi:hypothetical protein
LAGLLDPFLPPDIMIAPTRKPIPKKLMYINPAGKLNRWAFRTMGGKAKLIGLGFNIPIHTSNTATAIMSRLLKISLKFMKFFGTIGTSLPIVNERT